MSGSTLGVVAYLATRHHVQDITKSAVNVLSEPSPRPVRGYNVRTSSVARLTMVGSAVAPNQILLDSFGTKVVESTSSHITVIKGSPQLDLSYLLTCPECSNHWQGRRIVEQSVTQSSRKITGEARYTIRGEVYGVVNNVKEPFASLV